jgi:hypothetical protein
MAKWTEEQLQQHKSKSLKSENFYDKPLNGGIFGRGEIQPIKKRNIQHEEAMYEEFCLKFKVQIPNEWDYLYRVDPMPLRKLIGRIVKIVEKYPIVHKIINGIAGKAFAYLKRTGMKAGQFDYELRKCVGFVMHYYSLHIEFKYGKNKLTPEQEAFKTQQESQGRKCVVCYSAAEGIEAVKKYLRGEL